MRQRRETFVEASLESAVRDINQKVEDLETHPTQGKIIRIATAIESLKGRIITALEQYGPTYERQGKNFVRMAERATSASEMAMETMDCTDDCVEALQILQPIANELRCYIAE